MHARIATYRGASPDALTADLPQLTAMIERDLESPSPELAGLREIVLLADRAQGRVLAVTFFDTADDLHRADAALDHVAMAQAGGVRTDVERYEVVLRRSRS